jgi:hypothetical protein
MTSYSSQVNLLSYYTWFAIKATQPNWEYTYFRITLPMTSRLRISNKYGSVTDLNNDPTKQLRLRRRGFQPSLAHHWSEFFLEIRHQFHTSILLSNLILTNQQTSTWSLGSDACFEYTSCYFEVVTFFMRDLIHFHIFTYS